MRMIVLSALVAAGMGFAAAGSAFAAPLSNNGINNAAQSASIVDQVQYRRGGMCRTVRTCKVGFHGRKMCRTERICRR